MRYFYIGADNQAVGPVEGHAVMELRRKGLLADHTRVASEGDAIWRTYADFFRSGESVPLPPPLPALPPPVAVRVFGILNIVFGSMGLLCFPLTAGLMAAIVLGKTQTEFGPLHNGWLVFSVVLGVFLAGGLLLSGIGLCRFREWGRKLALVCAGVDIAQKLMASVVNMNTSPLISDHQLDCPKYWLGLALLLVALVIGLAYPVALVFFLRRSATREALLAQE